MRRIQFFTMVVPLFLAMQQQENLFAAKIYWTDETSGTVERANLDGTGHQTIVTGLPAAGGISIDPIGSKVYWTTFASIQRANLDGSSQETLVTGLHAYDVAVDHPGGKIFWTEGGNIRQASLDGSGVTTITAGLDGIANGIAVAPVQRDVYWGETGGQFGGDLFRRSMDGPPAELVNNFSFDGPWWLAVDEAGGKVYWATFNTGRIFRSDLSGANLELIVSGITGGLQGIALDPADGKIYWGEYHSIQRANLDGTNEETVIAGLDGGLVDIALDLTPVPEPTTLRLGFVALLPLFILGRQYRLKDRVGSRLGGGLR